MSLSTLKTVLSNLNPSVACPIYAKLSHHAPTLYSGASQEQLVAIILDVDKVSQMTGLEIISIMMWPDDKLPESLKSQENEILSKFNSSGFPNA